MVHPMRCKWLLPKAAFGPCPPFPFPLAADTTPCHSQTSEVGGKWELVGFFRNLARTEW